MNVLVFNLLCMSDFCYFNGVLLTVDFRMRVVGSRDLL